MPESRYTQLDKSIKEVLAKVNELHTSGEVLAEHVKNIDVSMATYSDHVKEQNGRVRKLEVWRGIVVGACLIGGGVIGVFGKALFDHLTQHP